MITKDILISDLVEKYPDSIGELLDIGLHCIGCGASALETLEQGLMVHGFSQEEIEKIIEKLNQILK